MMQQWAFSKLLPNIRFVLLLLGYPQKSPVVIQKMHPNIEMYSIQEAWLAKLGEWDESLKMYDIRLAKNPRDKEAVAGKLKCLDYLGRWEEAIALCNDSLEYMQMDLTATTTTVLDTGSTDLSTEAARPSGALAGTVSPVTISRPVDRRPTRNLSPGAFRGLSASSPPLPRSAMSTKEMINAENDRDKQLFTKAAVIGARSAWSLNKWGQMKTFVSQLPSDNVDACFLRAVMASHDEDYVTSAKYIEQTRKHLDSNISALLAESYSRAYHPLIMVQQCAEFEEIIDFKIQLKESGLDALSDSGGDDIMECFNDSSCRQGSGTRSIPIKKKSLRLCDVNNAEPSQESVASATPFSKLPARTLPATAEECDSEQLAQWTAQQNAKRMKTSLMDKWRRRIKGCATAGRAAIPVWKVRCRCLFSYAFM